MYVIWLKCLYLIVLNFYYYVYGLIFNSTFKLKIMEVDGILNVNMEL